MKVYNTEDLIDIYRRSKIEGLEKYVHWNFQTKVWESYFLEGFLWFISLPILFFYWALLIGFLFLLFFSLSWFFIIFMFFIFWRWDLVSKFFSKIWSLFQFPINLIDVIIKGKGLIVWNRTLELSWRFITLEELNSKIKEYLEVLEMINYLKEENISHHSIILWFDLDYISKSYWEIISYFLLLKNKTILFSKSDVFKKFEEIRNLYDNLDEQIINFKTWLAYKLIFWKDKEKERTLILDEYKDLLNKKKELEKLKWDKLLEKYNWEIIKKKYNSILKLEKGLEEKINIFNKDYLWEKDLEDKKKIKDLEEEFKYLDDLNKYINEINKIEERVLLNKKT